MSQGDNRKSSLAQYARALVRVPGVMLAGLAGLMTLLFGFYAREIQIDPSTVPLISAHARLFYGLALAATAAIGYASLDTRRAGVDESDEHDWTERYTAPQRLETSWILPSLAVLGSVLLCARYHRPQDIAAGVLLSATGVFAARTVRMAMAADHAQTAAARTAHLILTLGIAFVVLSLVYLYKPPAAYLAVVVCGVVGLLLTQVHDGIDLLPIRRIAYGVLGGIATAEASWGLGFWPPAGWWAGGMLTAVMLGCALITAAEATETLSRQAVVRSVGIAGALFAVCATLAQ